MTINLLIVILGFASMSATSPSTASSDQPVTTNHRVETHCYINGRVVNPCPPDPPPPPPPDPPQIEIIQQ
jgi:hypothetical protein